VGSSHHSLKSPLFLRKLDILWHSIRKLRTYEQIHTVFTRYLPCDGVYRVLSAGGNDRHRRTPERANHVYESSPAVTDALAQKSAGGLWAVRKTCVRMKKLTPFAELKSAIRLARCARTTAAL